VDPDDYNTDLYAVKFSSSDETKATVDEDSGLVTGVAAGAVIITAEFKYLVGEAWTSCTPAIKDTINLTVTAS